MKKITKFLIPLGIVLIIINFNVMTINANIPTTSPNIVYNSNRNIVGLKGIHIDGKVYNVQFIYGDLNEAYRETQNLWDEIPNPSRAINAINKILNSSNPIPRTIAQKPKNPKYPASYNNDFYMIPISIVERTYQKTSIEIRAVYSIFDKKTKQWQTSIDDKNLEYKYKSHGPRTAGVYTKFEEVKTSK